MYSHTSIPGTQQIIHTTPQNSQTQPSHISQPVQFPVGQQIQVPVPASTFNIPTPTPSQPYITVQNPQIPPPTPLQHVAPQSAASPVDPEILMEESESPSQRHWQTVPYTNKRIRLNDTSLYPQFQINSKNRFDLLVNEGIPDDNVETSNSTPRVIPKPPPIYIYNVNNYNDMMKAIATAINDEQYHTKTLANNTVKINVHTADTYRKLTRLLKDENVKFHTYQLKEERSYRIVIRNIHHSVPLTDIQNELEMKGHKVRNILNVRHRVTKEPLPLHFVDLEPNTNNKDIFDLRYIYNTKIKVEPPKKNRTIIQCTRCQQYGHSKTYCNNLYSCVKCGAHHDTKICSKSRNTPAKCALCNGSHPANYKGCEVYQELIQKRNRHHGNKHSAPMTTQVQPQLNTYVQGTTQHETQPDHAHNDLSFTYARAVANGPPTDKANGQALGEQLNSFLNEFKSLFSQLISQNNTMLNLLTTVINKFK